MTRKEHDVAALKCAGEQFVGGRAERSFDFDPTLLGKPFDVIEPTAADNSNTMSSHAGRYSVAGVLQRGFFRTDYGRQQGEAAARLGLR